MVAMRDIKAHHECVHGGQPQVSASFSSNTLLNHMTKYYSRGNCFNIRSKIASCIHKKYIVLCNYDKPIKQLGSK